jgi:hypothetical protein
MAFVLYFFVLLVSAASVVVGLDLMTSPLPSTPNVPLGRSAPRIAAEPPAQQVARAERETGQEKQLADRALSPIYPASPGPSAPMQTTGAAPADSAPAEPTQQASSAPAPTQQVVAEPVVHASRPSCDLQACSNAYRSFSAADCTYQPLEGPRRLCEKSDTATVAAAPMPRSAPQQKQAELSQPKQAEFAPPKQKAELPPAKPVASKRTDRDELAEVVRIVRQLPSPSNKPLALHPPQQRDADAREMSEAERIVRKMTRGYAGDISVIDGSGRVIIVRTGQTRAQAYRGE